MTSSKIKIIACFCMLLDHIGAILYPDLIILRIIGRIAFPLFAFLIVEGYFHTKNINKYLIRLGIFALISEIPFDRAFKGAWLEFSYQNVFFTLFIGLFAIYVYDKTKSKNNTLAVIYLIGFMILSIFIQSDYDVFGILTIFGLYKFRKQGTLVASWLFIVNGAMVLLATNYYGQFTLQSMTQIFAVGSLPIILLYNGKKGFNIKYLFYLFYPAHLLFLWYLAK